VPRAVRPADVAGHIVTPRGSALASQVEGVASTMLRTTAPESGEDGPGGDGFISTFGAPRAGVGAMRMSIRHQTEREMAKPSARGALAAGSLHRDAPVPCVHKAPGRIRNALFGVGASTDDLEAMPLPFWVHGGTRMFHGGTSRDGAYLKINEPILGT